jgi:hypothetical protein
MLAAIIGVWIGTAVAAGRLAPQDSGSGLLPAAALFEMLRELVVERLDVRASGQLRDLKLDLVEMLARPRGDTRANATPGIHVVTVPGAGQLNLSLTICDYRQLLFHWKFPMLSPIRTDQALSFRICDAYLMPVGQ